MPVGYGENAIKNRFNAKWKTRGYCFRIPQHRSDPATISDLVAGIPGKTTYSIEVKRISNRKTTYGGYKTKPLEFNHSFSISKKKNIEFPHQLERQVRLSQRMGWVPLLILQVVSPCVQTQEFLFSSVDLLEIMKDGKKSVSSSMFPDLHKAALYDTLFRIPDKRRVSKNE
jgi:hypothetical protein